MLVSLLALSLSATPFNPASPTEFAFGGSPDAHDFASICSSHSERVMDPAENPLARESLTQVDCEGFDYFGQARLAEFVFADGALTHVWVLVDATELENLQAAFTGAFGDPDREAPVFAAYFEARAAVRRDIPEALYYGEAAAPLFEAFFSQ
ncbi:hypothetical protein [Hyphobacterium sp.]|uniref:hypothetical protein n=1 Tax=Hyphobacterium sp. TaxID=2004662 RepID=UPI003BAD7596